MSRLLDLPAWHLIVLRTVVPASLTVFLFYWAFFHLALPAIKDNLMASKKELIQEQTRTAASILKTYHRLAASHQLTTAEAQKKAIEHIRSLRYGKEGKDYFWINDMVPKMVLHPYRTDLEGTDISGFQDPKGKFLFVAFVKAVESREDGFLDYMWQWKDNPDRIVPKLSYVWKFKPWGWVIGTGIYIEDVNRKIKGITAELTRYFTVIMMVIIVLSGILIWFSINTERERASAGAALRENESKYRSVVNNANEAIYVIQNGMLKYLNPKLVEIMGYSESELKSSSFPDFIHEDDRQMVLNRHQRRLDGETLENTYSHRVWTKNNEIKWLEINPIYLEWENQPATLVFASDVTQRKKAEEQIKANLEEKETLLQEIHHRVKNNMNVISSLLNLHNTSTQNEEVKKALQESQGRVYAMSAVHESLYASNNLAEIDLISYLKKLCASLIKTYSVHPGKVRLIVGGDDVEVNIDKASPLGLIVNELISNSLKYAFPDEQTGTIEVTTSKQGNLLVITIQDDGVGMPKGFDWKKSNTLGLKLVRNLIENQLNGFIDEDIQEGTQFTITINLDV